jgi:hypothetical protein
MKHGNRLRHVTLSYLIEMLMPDILNEALRLAFRRHESRNVVYWLRPCQNA